jgi:2-oxoglutarate ferredoxin oxidoreductase subunit delta
MARVIINEETCKGCGLCADACPRGVLAIHKERINAKGYNPIYAAFPEKCIGCISCALMCPDVCIEVER